MSFAHCLRVVPYLDMIKALVWKEKYVFPKWLVSGSKLSPVEIGHKEVAGPKTALPLSSVVRIDDANANY